MYPTAKLTSFSPRGSAGAGQVSPDAVTVAPSRNGPVIRSVPRCTGAGMLTAGLAAAARGRRGSGQRRRGENPGDRAAGKVPPWRRPAPHAPAGSESGSCGASLRPGYGIAPRSAAGSRWRWASSSSSHIATVCAVVRVAAVFGSSSAAW